MREARVARIVECHLEQKADYGRHSDLPERNSAHSEIVNILWKLKTQGRRETTIKNIGKCLRFLAKHVNLDNPQRVKDFIAYINKREGYKRNLINAYQHYLNYKGLKWIKPIYREKAKLPKIPTEEKLNMIINASPKRLALKLLRSE